MSFMATAVIGGAVIGAGASMYASSNAADAAETQADAQLEAAQLEAGYQQQALDYMKEQEELPTQFREGALTQLGGLYGLEGGAGSQQGLINQARQSPLYSSMLKEGQDAVLRNASATGGLRSGNVQSALADSSTNALLTAYDQQLQGLQGMAGLPSNVNSIAQQTSNIGSTYAQGIQGAGLATSQGQVASGQALQSGAQGIGDSLMMYGLMKGGI